jgi:rhodanese-related sulfurtransferase
MKEVIANKDQWPTDEDAPIVIYGGSGHRSTLAMAMNGYTDVRSSLKGGFGGWVIEGYPVVEYATMQ